jgi:hypothetical protein
MKKMILLFTIVLSSMMVYAQSPNAKEVKAIQVFLNQPSADGTTNAQALGVNVSNPADWNGVTWSGGNVVAIDWKDKKLAGVLNLENFKKLKSVDVSRNQLTGLSVSGSAVLSELNANRNRLTQLKVDGCTELAKLSVYHNRLLDLEVPVAPKTTDFTEVQYSYSDGANESVIENWEQLSNSDPEYNYIVDRYYYANVYTGSQKLLTDPQVQTKGVVNKNNITNKYSPDAQVSITADAIEIVDKNDNTKVYEKYTNVKNLKSDKELENAIKDFELFLGADVNRSDLYAVQDSDGTWHFVYSNGAFL